MLRLPFLRDLPYPDEGGLLVVAAHWHTGGPYLYGPLFVDRPPLLLAFFRLAASLGGVLALRLLGLGLVVAAVLCAARAGSLLGGTRGTVAATFTCAALLADPQLGTREVDAETVGVPLVLLAALLALEGVRRRPGGLLWLGASGAAGSAAILAKQNLADGLVFCLAFVAAEGVTSRAGAAQVARALGCIGLGAGVPVTAALAWSATSTGPRGLWFGLYGFRIASSGALFGESSASHVARLHELLRASLLSGLVALVVVAVVTLLRQGHRDALAFALIATLATEVIGVAGGGYFWTHYLVGLVPATCLLMGRAAGVVSRPLLLGAALAATVVATGTAVAFDASRSMAGGSTSEVGSLSVWINDAERPGDSAVVLYGEANLLETTGTRPRYPFLWTLPQRVLDPHLTRLAHTLEGKRGPTFVVVRSSLDPWQQDPEGRVKRALERRYRFAADVCGDDVYVRRGARRTTPQSSACA